MTDLPKLLRQLYAWNGTHHVQEAADEIERLRAELADEAAIRSRMAEANDALRAEVEALRAENEAVRLANIEGKMWVDNAVEDIKSLSSAIRWALGYDEGEPQFGEQAEQKGAFAWRAELRRRVDAALAKEG